jgi:hypothetical protein
METKTNKIYYVIAFSKRVPGKPYFLTSAGWVDDKKEMEYFDNKGSTDALREIMETAKGKRDILRAYVLQGGKHFYSCGSRFSCMFPLRQFREKRRKLIKEIGKIMSKEDVDFLGLNGENARAQWFMSQRDVERGERERLEKIISEL